MNAGSRGEFAAASCSPAAAVHALHFAKDTPFELIFSAPTMTIGICGRTLDAGKNSASAFE